MPTYGHSKTMSALAAAFYNTAIDAWLKTVIPYGQNVAINSELARIFCSTMNAAFCCELGFKAQLPFKTEGHDLKNLYLQWYKNDQKELIEYVINDSCYKQIEKRIGPNPLKCEDEATFMDYLEKCSKNFIDSRYVFEGNNAEFPFGFTFSLARCLLIPHGYSLDNEGRYLVNVI